MKVVTPKLLTEGFLSVSEHRSLAAGTARQSGDDVGKRHVRSEVAEWQEQHHKHHEDRRCVLDGVETSLSAPLRIAGSLVTIKTDAERLQAAQRTVSIYQATSPCPEFPRRQG